MEYLEITDELRANYHVYENAANVENVEYLVEMLSDRFAGVPEDLIWEIACDWTDYREWEYC